MDTIAFFQGTWVGWMIGRSDALRRTRFQIFSLINNCRTSCGASFNGANHASKVAAFRENIPMPVGLQRQVTLLRPKNSFVMIWSSHILAILTVYWYINSTGVVNFIAKL